MLTALAFAVCLLAAAALFAVTAQTSRLRPAPLLAATALVLTGYAAVLVTRPDGWLRADVVVLVVAVALGSSLGLLIDSRVALASFCLAASVADVVSFYTGPTAELLERYRSGANDLLLYLCLSLPIQDTLRPIIGIGDLFILAAIYFVFHRLGHRGVAAFAAPVAGLLVALGVGVAVGGIFGVPFVAATTLAYLWLAGKRGGDRED